MPEATIGCDPCDAPQKTQTQIFNADFLFIAITAVAVHMYAMVYTYLFVM